MEMIHNNLQLSLSFRFGKNVAQRKVEQFILLVFIVDCIIYLVLFQLKVINLGAKVIQLSPISFLWNTFFRKIFSG